MFWRVEISNMAKNVGWSADLNLPYGITLIDFKMQVRSENRGIVLGSTTNQKPLKVSSNDVLVFDCELTDNGYLRHKYRIAGYSSPSPEEITMSLSVSDNGGGVIGELSKTVGTLYPNQTTRWSLRFPIPKPRPNRLLDYLSIYIGTGRTRDLIKVYITLKHRLLTRFRLLSNKNIYGTGDKVLIYVYGIDQDGEYLHPIDTFPIYVRVNNGTPVYIGLLNHGSKIQLTTNTPGQMIIHVSDNSSFDTRSFPL